MIIDKKHSTGQFIDIYTNKLNQSIVGIDKKKLVKIINLIESKIKSNKKIFTCGNGGSASVANHFLCDFNKSIKEFSNKKVKPKIISLSNSIENITAISNDISFDEIFAHQLENYCQAGDCLLALSCSGKSTNILKVLQLAKKNKMTVIFITGFFKSKKVKYFYYHLNVNVKNYGISEDIFQMIMHIMSQYIKHKLSKNISKKIL